MQLYHQTQVMVKRTKMKVEFQYAMLLAKTRTTTTFTLKNRMPTFMTNIIIAVMKYHVQ